MSPGPAAYARYNGARVTAILRALAGEGAVEIPTSSPALWGAGADGARLAADAARREPAAQGRPAVRALKTAQALLWAHGMARRLDRLGPSRLLVWNGLKTRTAIPLGLARARGIPVVVLEDAPLPARLSVDAKGVNMGNSLPRARAPYARWREGRGAVVDAWPGLREGLVARASSSGRVGQSPRDLSGLGPFLFCPLQVPRDSQVLLYGGRFRRLEDHVTALADAAAALPPGWHLRLKEHPSSPVSLAPLLAPLAGPAFVIDNDTDTFAQVAASRGVVTLNSSVGLQAFLFDKPVVVTGQAFWDFAGMATPAPDPASLRAALARPERLTFDAAARRDLVDFLAAEWFPPEADVLAGRWSLGDMAARDARLGALLT